jgi:anti-anti-sigma factor
MLEIMRTRIGIITYLAPIGPFIEEEGLNVLKKMIGSCIAAHESNMVIDLEKVPALTGAALEFMIDTQEQLARLGGELKVVNANALLKDIFLITGFDKYVAIIEQPTG